MRPILLVEDMLSDVELMEIAFKRERISNPVIWLSSGEELVDWLWCSGRYKNRDLTILPLVVVLDLRMFAIDGLTSTRFIREGRQITKVPIIMHSSSKVEDDIERAYKNGADKYIIKSSDYKELCREIRKLNSQITEYSESPDQ